MRTIKTKARVIKKSDGSIDIVRNCLECEHCQVEYSGYYDWLCLFDDSKSIVVIDGGIESDILIFVKNEYQICAGCPLPTVKQYESGESGLI